MTTFLKSIQIEGFKSIRSSTLELRPLNVLIGANGAGKSNFISFFKMLNQIANGDFAFWVQKSGGASSLLHMGAKNTSKISTLLTYQIDEAELNYRFVIDHVLANDGFIFENEHSWYKTQERPYIMVNSTESSLLNAAVNNDQVGLQIRKLLLENRPYQFHDTSDTAYMKLTGTLDDDVFLRSDAGNLAAVLYKLKNHYPKHYKHILKTIQLTAPFFKDFVLEPNGHSIRLRYSEFGSDIVYGAHQISDGTLRFMALMTLLLQPLEQMPSVILIDEPELGLHPHALEVLLSIMRRVSTNRQIIVSTQSVSLVDRLEPEEVIVVERQNNESQFKRLDTQSLETWLEDYSLGELWEKNVFGGRPSR